MTNKFTPNIVRNPNSNTVLKTIVAKQKAAKKKGAKP